MSKTKSTSKAAKRAEPDVLTKVKDAAITKPAQTIKAKSKEIAKQIIGKEEKSKSKKDKKKAKEPTPEPSESEESDASVASSESESEEETAKPVAKGKANGVKKPAPKEESSDESDSESSASSESEAEPKAPKVNGASKKAKATEAKAEASSDESEASDSDESVAEAKADASDDESDDGSGDESSEDEKPAKKAAPKTVEAKKSAKADSESESESNDDSGEASDSSEDSEDEEKEVVAKPSKRKAEDEAEPIAKKSKTAPLDTSKGSNLFVGNLSWNVDEAWLREIFEEFGELSGVRLMTDRDSGRSKGFGYVEFVNAEDAAKAHAEKAGAEVDGRAMNVDYANARPDNSQKQDNRRKSYGDQVGEASDTLFLGNLSFEVGQETVTEAFAPHGTILGIRLPTDRETGQPKGFGYVTFSSIDEAKVALEAMQGAYIEGRPVRLDYSSPRPQNSDSPARGRGGFGGRGGAGGRGGRGGRGGNFGGRGGRGGRGGPRGGSTNRGGFGDYSGRKVSFD